jgi:hypothetical protein
MPRSLPADVSAGQLHGAPRARIGVTIHRRLTTANPGFRDDPASSLQVLGWLRRDEGDGDGARQAEEEASRLSQ